MVNIENENNMVKEEEQKKEKTLKRREEKHVCRVRMAQQYYMWRRRPLW
jgi:hypothetical protein